MKMFFDFNVAVRAAAAVGMIALSAGVVHAGTIPSFDTFGTLPGATFGGSGIPNNAVAITEVDGGSGNTFRLGLTAHQRYVGPSVTNDGNGTFTAPTGVSAVAPPGSARWNFAYYVEVLTGSADGYGFDLLYDFDPAAGTDESELGVGTLNDFVPPVGSALQDSQNLGFGFLATDIPGFITAPTFGPFNPNANGQYSFALIARGVTGGEIGRAAILVNTVPEPATLAMFSLLTLSAAGAYRRKKRAAAAC